MIVFDQLGRHLTSQKIVPGDTVTSLDKNCYQYREFFLLLDGVDAGSIVPVAGQWIVGQTSGAKAIVVSPSLTAGAYGNANARVTLRVKSMSGTFASTENIGIGANLDAFTVRTGTVAIPCPSGYDYEGLTAKAAFLVCSGNTCLIQTDGSTPDQTSLIGMYLLAGQNLTLKEINDIMNFKCMDYTSGSSSTLNVLYFF